MHRAILGLLLVSACGEDDGVASVDAGELIDGSAGPDVSLVDAAGPSGFFESFPNDDSWPPGWTPLGGVASASAETGRGRLVPIVSAYSLARMGTVGFTGLGLNLDASLRIEFADVGTQGIGFYMRQNGGYLQQSTPLGAGYAVFVEGFRGPRIGVWRERDGVEEEIAFTPLGPGGLQNGVVYAVRFQIEQRDTTTDLRAKIWPASETEPSAWRVMASDDLPALQNAIGGLAVDAWNTAQPPAGTPAPIFVDDIRVAPF